MNMQHIMIFLRFRFTCTSSPHHFQSQVEWNWHSMYLCNLHIWMNCLCRVPAIAPEGVASCFTIAVDHFCKIVRCWQLVLEGVVHPPSIPTVNDLGPGNFLSTHLPGNTPSGCEILQPRVSEGGFVAQLLSNS